MEEMKKELGREQEQEQEQEHKEPKKKFFDTGMIMIMSFMILLLAVAIYASVKGITYSEKCTDLCEEFNLTGVVYAGSEDAPCQCLQSECTKPSNRGTLYYRCEDTINESEPRL